jgi:solute carrier family 45 protein 1/2/4
VSSNFLVCIAMAATAIISWWSMKEFHEYVQHAITARSDVKAVCMVLFAFLGVPLAVSIASRPLTDRENSSYALILF